MGRGQVHHAGQSIRTIKYAIGAAKNFNLVEAGGEDAAKIHRASNFIQGNAIQKHFVKFALTTANQKGFIDPALAIFQNLNTRNRTQCLQHFRLVLELI